MQASADGLGTYSMNMKAFINAQGFSDILRDLPYKWGQYEGFAYLGLGFILLFILAIVYLGGNFKDFIKVHRKNMIPLTVVFIMAIIVALSPKVYQLWFFRCIINLSYRVTFLCNVLANSLYNRKALCGFFSSKSCYNKK